MSGLQAEPSDTLTPTLVAGLTELSRSQTIPFVQYSRYILPLDGYVFWLRVQQTSIAGSLHFDANSLQNEDDSPTINRVIFTTTEEVAEFQDIDPDTIWIGEWPGLKFAFSQHGFFYDAAKLFHYSGNAVYPVMEAQLVDIGAQLPLDTLIVSNSLPAWLAVKSYTPEWLVTPNPRITLYPSFLIPDNLQPPYGAVHIDPSQTGALQTAGAIGRTGTHQQLAIDHVRVTLYGLTNDQAIDWLDTVERYSYDMNIIGMMNMPIVRDEKRTQQELNVIAMKKTVEFDVSYNQTRINNVVRQLITAAAATLYPLNPNGEP